MLEKFLRWLWNKTSGVAVKCGALRRIGSVYFIATKDMAAVKIGHTAQHVRSRLSDFLLSYPSDDALVIVGAVAGNRHLEKFLHRRFSHLALRREWFRFGPEIDRWLRRAQKDPSFYFSEFFGCPQGYGSESSVHMFQKTLAAARRHAAETGRAFTYQTQRAKP